MVDCTTCLRCDINNCLFILTFNTAYRLNERRLAKGTKKNQKDSFKLLTNHRRKAVTFYGHVHTRRTATAQFSFSTQTTLTMHAMVVNVMTECCSSVAAVLSKFRLDQLHYSVFFLCFCVFLFRYSNFMFMFGYPLLCTIVFRYAVATY